MNKREKHNFETLQKLYHELSGTRFMQLERDYIPDWMKKPDYYISTSHGCIIVLLSWFVNDEKHPRMNMIAWTEETWHLGLEGLIKGTIDKINKDQFHLRITPHIRSGLIEGIDEAIQKDEDEFNKLDNEDQALELLRIHQEYFNPAVGNTNL